MMLLLRVGLLAIAAVAASWTGAVEATQWSVESALCDQAALNASDATGVPLRVLLAITRVETGRSRDGLILPWPWAANFAGDGVWFDGSDRALAALSRAAAAGRSDFDIGCFQLNYRWHAHGFESLDAMLDPFQNARYAARFLHRLHDEFGTWEAAVGAYHSRTRALADRYLARFNAVLADLPHHVASTDRGLAPASDDASRQSAPRPLDIGRRPALWSDTRSGAAPLMMQGRRSAPGSQP